MNKTRKHLIKLDLKKKHDLDLLVLNKQNVSNVAFAMKDKFKDFTVEVATVQASIHLR